MQIKPSTPFNPITHGRYYDSDGSDLCTPEPRSGEWGNLVKSVLGDVVTYYVGAHYEKQIQSSQQNVRKYYFAGASRIAMRENGTLKWLISDHLGSTTVTANASGNLVSSLRYTAFGELSAASGTTSMDYRYTGHLEEDYIKLY